MGNVWQLWLRTECRSRAGCVSESSGLAVPVGYGWFGAPRQVASRLGEECMAVEVSHVPLACAKVSCDRGSPGGACHVKLL